MDTIEYSDSSVLCFKEFVSESKNINNLYITAVEDEVLFRRAKNTSPGFDSVPSWGFQYCSYDLAELLTYSTVYFSLVLYQHHC